MPKGVSLNALRVLSTVAQTQSFKEAAQRLGVTQSAVSRQIQTLEEQLGTRLIQRDNRMHALTPAGHMLAPELNQIFNQLDELINTLGQSKAADVRTLKVALPDVYLSHLLAPKLADFSAIYPHITLQFCSSEEYLRVASKQQSDAQEKLLQEQVDVVIGCGSLPSKQIVSQRLTPLEYTLIGEQQGPFFSVQQSDDLISLMQQSDLTQPDTIHQQDSTAAALTLTQVQNGSMLLPSFLQRTVTAQSPSLYCCPQHLPSDGQISLQCFYSKHRERELAIVAFVNWLSHWTAKL